MIWLLMLLCAVIAAAFVGMLRLRRASDRAWRERRVRTVFVTLIADSQAFERALQKCAAATRELGLALSAERVDPDDEEGCA